MDDPRVPVPGMILQVETSINTVRCLAYRLFWSTFAMIFFWTREIPILIKITSNHKRQNIKKQLWNSMKPYNIAWHFIIKWLWTSHDPSMNHPKPHRRGTVETPRPFSAEANPSRVTMATLGGKNSFNHSERRDDCILFRSLHTTCSIYIYIYIPLPVSITIIYCFVGKRWETSSDSLTNMTPGPLLGRGAVPHVLRLWGSWSRWTFCAARPRRNRGLLYRGKPCFISRL